MDRKIGEDENQDGDNTPSRAINDKEPAPAPISNREGESDGSHERRGD